MEIADIQGQPRTKGSHHANDRIRRDGLVPGVVYGHGEAVELISLSRHDLELALEHLRHVVSVKMGGAPRTFLIKDVQFDHLQKTPIHVDLMRVDTEERVEVKVPIVLRGTARGAAEGGVLTQLIADIDVECKVLEIPEEIRIRVDHLGLDETLFVRDIEFPPGATPLVGPDEIVAVVRPPRGMHVEAEAPAEGSATEPERIGRVAREEEGDSGS